MKINSRSFARLVIVLAVLTAVLALLWLSVRPAGASPSIDSMFNVRVVPQCWTNPGESARQCMTARRGMLSDESLFFEFEMREPTARGRWTAIRNADNSYSWGFVSADITNPTPAQRAGFYEMIFWISETLNDRQPVSFPALANAKESIEILNWVRFTRDHANGTFYLATWVDFENDPASPSVNAEGSFPDGYFSLSRTMLAHCPAGSQSDRWTLVNHPPSPYAEYADYFSAALTYGIGSSQVMQALARIPADAQLSPREWMNIDSFLFHADSTLSTECTGDEPPTPPTPTPNARYTSFVPFTR